MKRLIPVLLVMALLASGCGSSHPRAKGYSLAADRFRGFRASERLTVEYVHADKQDIYSGTLVPLRGSESVFHTLAHDVWWSNKPEESYLNATESPRTDYAATWEYYRSYYPEPEWEKAGDLLIPHSTSIKEIGGKIVPRIGDESGVWKVVESFDVRYLVVFRKGNMVHELEAEFESNGYQMRHERDNEQAINPGVPRLIDVAQFITGDISETELWDRNYARDRK